MMHTSSPMKAIAVILALAALAAAPAPALAARLAPLLHSATLGSPEALDKLATSLFPESQQHAEAVTTDAVETVTAAVETAAVEGLEGLEAEVLAVKGEFDAFLAKFEKKYAYGGAQYVHRLGVFAANLKRAAERQLDDTGSAVHGVTRFSDLTPEEFKTEFLGTPISAEQIQRRKAHPLSTTLPDLPTADLPLDFDWREKGAVTPVKNQGQCGSCWAYSTTGAVEGANFIKSGTLTSLSEQQLVDCDHTCDPDEPAACDAGCNGGLPANAMEYVMKAGLDTEDAYPYKAVKGTCAAKKHGPTAATLTNFSFVSTDEEQIAAALVSQGPLSIGIDAAWMQTYIGGVACPFLCSKANLDHGVLIVGYGASKFAPVRLHREPYWIIKNSWGPSWGVEGYYQICKDKGSCGLNTMVVAASA
eukprot:CAMPEP_0197589154 /NCGR_PEP_ID=MMETSP1326-20131121/10186_1 /TAXON_ID=1155430 /ORGANISM="Genus nov. species nov., Strain RCC2288" /LENGTH=417 /DNA_ID=CAMNT_0043154067 /DNA_START=80 /DNA_END=1333 /DNA_ORIENTATION=+